jgi:hypothetical protein
MAKTNEPTIIRVFVSGAPGSGWGRIDKMLRAVLDNADNTDMTYERVYSSGNSEKTYNHLGAFFNPGNEFGDWILNFRHYTREEIIEKLDSVYEPSGELDPRVLSVIDDCYKTKPDGKYLIRMHKSHYWPYHLDKIKDLFPDAFIVNQWQLDHKCYVWWEHSEGFNLRHDSYDYYENDYEAIWNQVRWQNSGIERFAWEYGIQPEYFNMDWMKKHFGHLSPLTPFQQIINPDGIPRLSIPPGAQKNMNTTGKLYCYDPFINSNKGT